MRARVLSVLAVGLLLAGAACGDDDEDSGATTTSTSAAGSTTIDYSRFRSTDTVAVNLDRSLMSAAEVKAAASLSADPTSYPGRGNAPPPPQGPLNVDGVAAIFPAEAYKGALQEGQASVGANRTFLDAKAGLVLNTLAIKFESAATAQKFVQFATNVATTLGGATVAQHPEFKVGVLPGQVVRVPPTAGATPPIETVVAAVLYPNGVYYQTSIAGPVGAVSDATAIAYATAQDAKYQSVKAQLAIG